ncbi:MAG: hypothetical protein RLZZ241_2 [Bacteroidota bacterium]|jgi:RNA polymerase sigma-70 factor (ECF subfamily)
MTQLEFLETVTPFKERMHRVGRYLLHSEEEAADATQEVLLKLWVGKQKLHQYSNVEAYAMTMMRNFCLDRLKSKSASNRSLVQDDYLTAGSDLELSLELKDSLSWIEVILKTLPDAQRRILELRDIEALEFDEIASIMKMNPTAVRVALSRARKTVREQLKQKHQYGLR